MDFYIKSQDKFIKIFLNANKHFQVYWIGGSLITESIVLSAAHCFMPDGIPLLNMTGEVAAEFSIALELMRLLFLCIYCWQRDLKKLLSKK